MINRSEVDKTLEAEIARLKKNGYLLHLLAVIVGGISLFVSLSEVFSANEAFTSIVIYFNKSDLKAEDLTEIFKLSFALVGAAFGYFLGKAKEDK